MSGLQLTWHELILPDNTTKDEVVRYTRVAERYKTLQHPSLINFVEFWTPDPSRLVYLTESHTGSSILGHVTPGSNYEIRQPLIVRWMVPIIGCLHYLHSQSPPIIHGDVWPSSIFTKPASRTMKLSPPALGRDAESMTITNRTPPEFFFGNMGTSSDIWGVGLSILFLLTKQAPYAECNTPAALFRKLLAYEPPAALGLVQDEQAVDLIRSCLTIPATRSATQDLLHHPYFAAREPPETPRPAGSSDGRFVILPRPGVKPSMSFGDIPKEKQDLG
jgi:WNK lysine deficient protein kinase